MGDGWETRRRREPGNDWIIIKLATKGLIKKIEIDTAHFKGNYPDEASVQVSNFDEKKGLEETINDSQNWKYILDKSKLLPILPKCMAFILKKDQLKLDLMLI